MKKLAYLLTVLSLVMALVPAAAFAHTEDEPFVTNLIAGQHMDAGDVHVWNDGHNLYVQFVAQDGWCIIESHVAVGSSVEDIPQTKKENPVPGKFMNSAVYSPCETNPDPYVIPLEWAGGDTVYIATHAVVVKKIEGCYETVWQIGDVETYTCEGGLPTNYADEFNWSDPAGPCTAGPSLAVEEPLYTDPFVVGTTLINEFPYNSNFNRGYATNFDVQWNGELHFGGELIVSWSPGQSATEKKVVSDGFVDSPVIFTAYGSPTAGGFLDKYPVVQHTANMIPLALGTHTINFQHTQGDGTFWDWIRLEKPCEQWESAWGEGTFFDGANWAMYFTYTVQEELVCPQITDYSYVETADGGTLELLTTPLNNVSAGQNTSENARVFLEYGGDDHGGFKLDINNANQTNAVTPPYGFSVNPGTPVCSYYVHFDDGDYTEPEYDVLWASLTFEEEIIGLIVAGTINTNDIFYKKGINTLCDTDAALGAAGTTYPTAGGCGINGDARGLEIFNADPTLSSNQDPVQISGNTIEFKPLIANKHDSFRIILPANYVP